MPHKPQPRPRNAGRDHLPCRRGGGPACPAGYYAGKSGCRPDVPAATPNGEPDVWTNPWELYSSKPGWEAVAERLDCAVTDALAALDSAVAVGETAGKAAEDAFASVNAVMDHEENASFGASDTERATISPSSSSGI